MASYSLLNTADTRTGSSQEGVAVSSTNTYYTSVMSGKHTSGQGFTLKWTGTPTGTFTFWVTDKPNPSLADDTDWVQDSTNFTAVNPAGSASTAQHNVTSRHAFCRVKYVNASGSGTLFCYYNIERNA